MDVGMQNEHEEVPAKTLLYEFADRVEMYNRRNVIIKWIIRSLVRQRVNDRRKWNGETIESFGRARKYCE